MHSFFCRTIIYSGSDAMEALKLYPAERILLVTDRFFSEQGIVEDLKMLLPDSDITVFDNVIPDPPLTLAVEGARICKDLQPNLLIALGGGSPIDCAKAIYLAAGLSVPFIAIPTTSGTGSEMTSFSILTHDGIKHPLLDETIRPTAAILDTRFLKNIPASLIADAGMDLITHCLEALAAKQRTGFTNALAGYALQIAMNLLPKSFQGDFFVRGTIHEAASMAGIAFDQAGLGVCHALAHALGGVFHIPHGRLCAMLLPAVIRYNMPETMEQYVLAARFCGIQSISSQMAVRELIQRLEQTRQRIRLPDNLEQAGVTVKQWNTQKRSILESAYQDPCCRNNPVPVTMEGLEEICRTVAP